MASLGLTRDRPKTCCLVCREVGCAFSALEAIKKRGRRCTSAGGKGHSKGKQGIDHRQLIIGLLSFRTIDRALDIRPKGGHGLRLRSFFGGRNT